MTRVFGRRIYLGDMLLWVIGMLVTLIWTVPLVWMMFSSFKPEGEILTKTPQLLPSQFVLDSYLTVFKQPVLKWFINSTMVSLGGTLLTLFVSATAGYAFARFSFRGKNALFALLLATLIVPFEVTMIPLYLLMTGLHLTGTLVAMILPDAASAVGVYIFRNFFLSFPRELEDAAAIDGSGAWGTFFRIALPLARPAILAVAILGFVGYWNAFLWPLLVSSPETTTMALGISIFRPAAGFTGQTQYLGQGLAAATLLALPTLLIFFVLQRYFIEGVTTSGLKG
ncbi:MAG TPA: carbohydrate ABC transporter permease [Anaerolineae bacterium]|nr:carbohydrate ABC transporter permease [Anaerolineae bacterium]